MERSLLSLLPSLCCVLFHLTMCSGQMDHLGEQQRCVSLNSNVTDLPLSCERFYSPENGYFNGSEIMGLQMALSRISHAFHNESDDLNLCIDLVEHYLCHYYFPLCNLTTGETTLVCSSSCALLVNNEDCSELRTIVNKELEQDDIIPPDDVCIQTHSTHINPPTISGHCLSIEDTLNESLPLMCIEIPDETCRSQILYSFYAPNAIVFTPELSNEFQVIISQMNLLDPCRGYLTYVMCAHKFPACNDTTDRLIPVCLAACSSLTQIIQECSGSFFFINDPDYPLTNELTNSFSCETQSYINFPHQYIETDPNECIEFMQGTASASPTGSNVNGLIIGVTTGSVLVVCIIVVIIMLLVLFVRQYRIIKYAARHSSDDYTKPPRMLRYHAQADSHQSLDLQLGNTYTLSHRRDLEEEEILQCNRRSLLLEVNEFLQYVKERFSEVLLPVDTITKQSVVGKGAFGVVHKGEMISSDGTVKAVAIKTIKSGSLDGMKDLIAESSIMKTFHHPNVLPLLGVCIDYDDEDVLKIVTPFMANGDLKTFLKHSRIAPNNSQEYPKDLSEEILMRMCFDIAKGMEYLAKKRYIHRDLAGRNCMVDTLLTIKIADFGLAKDVYSTEYYRVDKHTTLPVKWMSIESLLDGYFDEKTDVWSYGVTCWEIFSLGKLPYPGVDNAKVISLLKSGQRLEQPELCPAEMNELIKGTWLENPDERPTFATIVQNLKNICNFTETTTTDTEFIKDTEETAESSNYISVLPK